MKARPLCPLCGEGSTACRCAPAPRAFNVERLRELPTLSVGHFDNLKIDLGDERTWLSRCTRADGMCCNAHVTVERLVGGVWEPVLEECHDEVTS